MGRRLMNEEKRKVKKTICLSPEIWDVVTDVAKEDYPTRKSPPLSPTIETLIRISLYKGREVIV